MIEQVGNVRIDMSFASVTGLKSYARSKSKLTCISHKHSRLFIGQVSGRLDEMPKKKIKYPRSNETSRDYRHAGRVEEQDETNEM